MAFHVSDPDFVKSPFTGMSREHWVLIAGASKTGLRVLSPIR